MQPGEMAELRAWIGRRSEAEDVVTERLVEGFRTTLAPHLASRREDEAPLGIHWCLAPATTSRERARPGRPSRQGHPAAPRALAAAHVGRRRDRGIAGIAHRRSGAAAVGHHGCRGEDGALGAAVLRNGRPRLFDGARRAFRERHDIVYREMPGPAPAPLPPPPASGPPPAERLVAGGRPRRCCCSATPR